MICYKQFTRTLAAVLLLALLGGTALPAMAQKSDTPSSLLTKTMPTTEGDGYMVAGDFWNTVKPMNTTTANGVEDPNRGDPINGLHWLTLGPDGTNWLEPNGLWPGGYDLTSNWRDGTRLTFPVFEADGWGDALRASGDTDDQYMFAYYTPNVPGAGDPARDYKRPARFTDDTRTHLVYEAGWPTTAGLDFKIRAHQFTPNEQNVNDFVAIEVSMTNTGVVDANGDGTPELQDHAIDAVAASAWLIPSISVRIRQNSGRSNRFGAGRTMGYLNPTDDTDYPLFVYYANVPPNRTDGRTVPAEGDRLIGVNDGRVLEGYTDVWNTVHWLGAKEGAIDDNNLGALAGAPDKQTLFGTHPVGQGSQRGWYTSATNQDGALHSPNRADLAFWSSTATWFEDYGRTLQSNFDNRDLAPNSDVFSGGTAGDVTTFGQATPGVRPSGDHKFGSLSEAGAIGQPVWEDALLNSGDFYDAVGFTQEYTFGQTVNHGMGPFGLEVGESVTVVFVMAGGFRYEGVNDAVRAADWAWQNGWDIRSDLPAPPAPEMKVESTTDGTAVVRWTDVTGIDPDVDGYKVWRAAQFQRQSWFPSQEEGANGFALVDNYHRVHEVGASTKQFADEGNPYFDAFGEFAGDTQNFYQPSEWGPYELIAKIPVGEVAQFNDPTGGYNFAFEDEEAITGFTYWYYVSAYKEGSFSGPQGAVPVGHIESSNFNRNGRNSPDVADGQIGDITPWINTYPFAINASDYPAAGTQNFKNIGGPFTVTPPAAPVDQVADLVTVTPNPYKITGLNDERDNPSSHNIDFLNLPENFTLTIIDVSGQIIFQETIEGATNGKYTWDMFSKDGVEVASGLYIYHVSFDGGDREVVGHFSILR
ncbi:MAG: T9SS type A sorting domain-containing protein [Bacteroidetes bacterium]|jgi:hypothetical protein|nr:T9SS type A sorting domain-containing protein [Bacteroidota bacterium]